MIAVVGPASLYRFVDSIERVGRPVIEFNCPQCQAPLKVKPELAGRRGKCVHCGEKISVPPIVAPGPPADNQQPPSLAPCPDCGNLVSLLATACPKCGAPLIEDVPSEERHPGLHSTMRFQRGCGTVCMAIFLLVGCAAGYYWLTGVWWCWVVLLFGPVMLFFLLVGGGSLNEADKQKLALNLEDNTRAARRSMPPPSEP